jgi:thiol-disulfide isomerase/thioredoxin
MNKNLLLSGVVVLVLGLATAIGVTLSSEPNSAGLPEGEISIQGVNLASYSDGPDEEIGSSAPSFSGPGIDSEIISVEKDGNAKAIVFLAHWCPHCQREVPIIQEYINVVGLPEGVDLIAIATSIDKGRENYPPTAWLEREGWTSPAIFDLNKEIAKAYGLTAFPYWVFVDKDFNVLARRTGNIPQDLIGQLLIALAEN